MNSSFKNYLPLLGILVGIIAATFLKQFLAGTGNMFSAMTDFMGLFFITFSLFKIFNIKNFAAAYQQYDLIAMHVPAYAYIYPFIELSLGISYLVHFKLLLVSSITLIIMLIGSAGIALALRAGRAITCGRLGTVFSIPVTIISLLEDLLMAAMALTIILISK